MDNAKEIKFRIYPDRENRKTSPSDPGMLPVHLQPEDLPCVGRLLKMGKRSAIPRLPPC